MPATSFSNSNLIQLGELYVLVLMSIFPESGEHKEIQELQRMRGKWIYWVSCNCFRLHMLEKIKGFMSLFPLQN